MIFLATLKAKLIAGAAILGAIVVAFFAFKWTYIREGERRAELRQERQGNKIREGMQRAPQHNEQGTIDELDKTNY